MQDETSKTIRGGILKRSTDPGKRSFIHPIHSMDIYGQLSLCQALFKMLGIWQWLKKKKEKRKRKERKERESLVVAEAAESWNFHSNGTDSADAAGPLSLLRPVAAEGAAGKTGENTDGQLKRQENEYSKSGLRKQKIFNEKLTRLAILCDSCSFKEQSCWKINAKF